MFFHIILSFFFNNVYILLYVFINSLNIPSFHAELFDLTIKINFCRLQNACAKQISATKSDIKVRFANITQIVLKKIVSPC